MNTSQNKQSIEFIRLPEVRKLTSLSTATIYRMVACGKFPKQVKLGDRSVAWVKTELQAWGQKKIDDTRASDSAFPS